MHKAQSLRRCAVALLFLAVSLPAVAQTSSRRLMLDEWVTGSVRLGDDWQSTSYTLYVRDDVFSIHVELADSVADLDLFLYDTNDDLVDYSELTVYNEELYLSRVTDPELRPGRYTLEVVYPFEMPPSVDNRILTAAPYQIRVEAARLEPLATLEPGRQVTGRLLPDNGMIALYELNVSASTQTLRLDISDTDADVDLFLFEGDVPADLFSAEYLAQTLRSTESIVLNRSSAPPLRTGTYHLLVIDQVTLEQEADFRLSVSASETAPAHLHGVPDLPEPATDLERALLATVEVLGGGGAGGSGTILTPDGMILTNWHVVEGSDGEPDPDITIGLSLDHRKPPAEILRAEVVEFSPERDLALLSVTGDRYGEPLPRGYELPSVELRMDEVGIAEQLHFIGYPGVGGTGSRASITYTRGVVSGFQQTAFGYEIKTDGEINSGNSGGAALDGSFRLVGVPSSIVGEDAGQIAYLVPVTAIPSAWLRHLR